MWFSFRNFIYNPQFCNKIIIVSRPSQFQLKSSPCLAKISAVFKKKRKKGEKAIKKLEMGETFNKNLIIYLHIHSVN